MSSQKASKRIPKLSHGGGENSTKVPRFGWKVSGMGAYGVGLSKNRGATKRSLRVGELLCFTRLFAWFYEIFGLFEISPKLALEGFAVASLNIFEQFKKIYSLLFS